jgi:adenine specific DNA methylase Mod
MKYLVNAIEFDFSDSQGELDEWEQDQIVKNNIGVWEADDEEDLIEEVTTSSGWCIKNIDYEIQLK